MKNDRVRKYILIGCAVSVGFAAGVASTVAWQRYAYRPVVTFVARADLNSDDIRIPAGTELIYEERLAPGVHLLRLPLHMDSLTYNSKLVPTGRKKRSSLLETWVD